MQIVKFCTEICLLGVCNNHSGGGGSLACTIKRALFVARGNQVGFYMLVVIWSSKAICILTFSGSKIQLKLTTPPSFNDTVVVQLFQIPFPGCSFFSYFLNCHVLVLVWFGSIS